MMQQPQWSEHGFMRWLCVQAHIKVLSLVLQLLGCGQDDGFGEAARPPESMRVSSVDFSSESSGFNMTIVCWLCVSTGPVIISCYQNSPQGGAVCQLILIVSFSCKYSILFNWSIILFLLIIKAFHSIFLYLCLNESLKSIFLIAIILNNNFICVLWSFKTKKWITHVKDGPVFWLSVCS